MLNRISFAFIGLAFFCFGMPPTINEVVQVARTHSEIEGGGAIAQIVPVVGDSGELANIVLFEPTGWAIIPSEKDLRPIIAYSLDSDFDVVESPENFPLAIFKHDIETRIRAIPQISETAIRKNRELWRAYLNSSPSLYEDRTSSSQWGPYLDTKWNQDDPYNIFCPIDPETGAKCPIGCVVTAMGQIVNYWEWPPSIIFDTTDSYMSNATEPPIFIDALTANIDTIDYNGFGFHPEDTTMAKLLWACGVAVKMQYKDGGSSAYSRDVAISLVNKFGYLSADGIMPSSPSFYTDILWDVMNHRTTYLSIHSAEVGHAIVIDGYRETGEFHANFGWGGSADAWYFLPDSLPHELTTVNYAIVNIVPPVITHRPPENITADALTGGHVMVRWAEPFDNTEPVLRYKIFSKHIDAPEFNLVGTTTGFSILDRYPPELKDYVYAVSAVYANDVGSKLQSTDVFTEIHDGWNRMITVVGDETPNGIAPNGMGGFVAVGNRDMAGSTNLYVVNIGVGGDTIWTKTIGGAGYDTGNAIKRTPDGGYVVVGETESFGDGSKDMWLLRFNSTGDTLWTKTFGTAGNDAAKDIALLPAGGYAILGHFAPSGSNLMTIIGIDPGGELLWEKTYDGIAGNSIAESGGSLFIGGYHTAGPLGNNDALLMKTDMSGDSLWTRAYGGANADLINSIAIAPDGGIVLAGNSRSFGMPLFQSVYYLKTDSHGNEIFSGFVGGMSDHTAEGITAIDGGFITIGTITQSGNRNILLVYLDEDGDTVKTHVYSTAGTNIGRSIIALEDSSIALAGRIYNAGTNDFWLMKVGGPVSPVAEMPPSKPQAVEIYAYPNPFNSAVNLVFEGMQPLSVEIFDLAGRRIERVLNCDMATQSHATQHVIWTPDESLPSGVYLVRARGGESVAAKRVLFLK